MENGTSDPFYQRFTTPKQEALILGNSKAAQGIIPSILNDELKGVYSGKLYNYSFTVYNSPYGPAYLKSIKKKLADYNEKRCFIVTVDPWSIASDIEDPDNSEKFEENKRFIADISNVSSAPNFRYLLKWFSKSFYEIILMELKNNLSKLHDDGWFETTAELGGSTDEERRLFMVNYYNDYLNKYSFSKERLKYLKQTIEFLKSKGSVYLVRMPLHQDILKIEEKLDPGFSLKMESLSKEFEIPYIEFSDLENDLEFKDGLHLTIDYAKEISKELALRITRLEYSLN